MHVSQGLTEMSVAHHVLGPRAQVLLHVLHQLVDVLHWQGQVILVHTAIMSQGLCDALSQSPQSLPETEPSLGNV